MTKKKAEKAERVFVNPFSGDFLPHWNLWKDYKKKEFQFAYKSEISENAAIGKLWVLSSGKEDMAFKIIMQSIENGWKGHFNLKNNYGAYQRSSQTTKPIVEDVTTRGTRNF